MEATTIRNWISIAAVIGIATHIAMPNLKIDAITLTLFGIGLIPWLAPLFKSLELPGGVKVEFQDLKNISDRAFEVGLVSERQETSAEHEFSFQLVADKDPNLARAGLRIEIEKRLIKLAENNNLLFQKRGIGSLLLDLNNKQLINAAERSVLNDMIGLLNSAVHGATIEKSATGWVLEGGPRILHALDDRVTSKEVKYKGIT